MSPRMKRLLLPLVVLLVAAGSSEAATHSPKTVCARGGQAVAPTAKQLRANAALCVVKGQRGKRSGFSGQP